MVALGRGGALDTVIEGETGVLVGDTSVEALAEGFDRAVKTPWSPARIRTHAERFSRARFATDIRRVVDETLDAPRDRRW